MVAVLVLYPEPLPSREVDTPEPSTLVGMKSVQVSSLWGLETLGLVLQNVAERMQKSLLEVTVTLKVTPLLEILELHQTPT